VQQCIVQDTVPAFKGLSELISEMKRHIREKRRRNKKARES
jgi:hypothetical protein